LSDVFGRKQVFMVAQIIFLGGTALCGGSPNMIALIIGRAIAG
jgi:MFS family permease